MWNFVIVFFFSDNLFFGNVLEMLNDCDYRAKVHVATGTRIA